MGRMMCQPTSLRYSSRVIWLVSRLSKPDVGKICSGVPRVSRLSMNTATKKLGRL